MRIAVPVHGGAFCEHFGRADGFFLCEVDITTKQVEQPRFVVRPKAKCEAVPTWLEQMCTTTVLAGGIGEVAKHHLADLGIAVSVGHAGKDPKDVVVRSLVAQTDQPKNPCPDLEHRHHHCRQQRTAKLAKP